VQELGIAAAAAAAIIATANLSWYRAPWGAAATAEGASPRFEGATVAHLPLPLTRKTTLADPLLRVAVV